MKRLIPIVALALATACSQPDRGACRQSHVRPRFVSMVWSGKAMIPIVRPAARVCDVWEFPSGRPALATPTQERAA